MTLEPTPQRHTVLAVDDDPAILAFLHDLLTTEGYDATVLSSATIALETARKHHFDCILLDLLMPGLNGLAFLKEIKTADPRTEVIMVTGRGEIELAVRAIKLGAFDYLTKPVSVPKLVSVLRSATGKAARSAVAAPALQTPEVPAQEALHGLLAASPSMKLMFQRVRQVAQYFSALLVTGPAGSGKDLLAAAVHRESDRAQGRLVRFNCAAVAADAVEAHVFGDAGSTPRPGLVEQAAGGVLLLDQVERLPSHVQSKLLGYLDTGEYSPAGSTEVRACDARLIAMTSRDLRALSEARQFLEEVYYRISRIELAIPPLYERPEDIALLAVTFLSAAAARRPTPARGFSPLVWSIFSKYPWEGNIRELDNTVESAALVATGDVIDVDDLPRGLVEYYRKNQQLFGKEILSSLAEEFRKPRSRK